MLARLISMETVICFTSFIEAEAAAAGGGELRGWGRVITTIKAKL